MNAIDLLRGYTCAALFIIFTQHTDYTLGTHQWQMRREIRYTKIDVKILNETVGTVLESGIKPLRNKHMLFFHLIFHQKIPQFDGAYSVSKCKQYFIDCVNVVSYDINDICSKLDAIALFTIVEDSSKVVEKCPIYGEYNYNITIEADKFGAMFSFPTEKWWEHYWKVNVQFRTTKTRILGFVKFDFYFLDFRVRNRGGNN